MSSPGRTIGTPSGSARQRCLRCRSSTTRSAPGCSNSLDAGSCCGGWRSRPHHPQSGTSSISSNTRTLSAPRRANWPRPSPTVCALAPSTRPGCAGWRHDTERARPATPSTLRWSRRPHELRPRRRRVQRPRAYRRHCAPDRPRTRREGLLGHPHTVGAAAPGLRRLVQGRHIAREGLRTHRAVLRGPRLEDRARRRARTALRVELEEHQQGREHRPASVLRVAGQGDPRHGRHRRSRADGRSLVPQRRTARALPGTTSRRSGPELPPVRPARGRQCPCRSVRGGRRLVVRSRTPGTCRPGRGLPRQPAAMPPMRASPGDADREARCHPQALRQRRCTGHVRAPLRGRSTCHRQGRVAAGFDGVSPPARVGERDARPPSTRGDSVRVACRLPPDRSARWAAVRRAHEAIDPMF